MKFVIDDIAVINHKVIYIAYVKNGRDIDYIWGMSKKQLQEKADKLKPKNNIVNFARNCT